MGLLHIRGWYQQVALLKVLLVCLSSRLQCSWTIENYGSLLVTFGIAISPSIAGLFLGPGMLPCNSACSM